MASDKVLVMPRRKSGCRWSMALVGWAIVASYTFAQPLAVENQTTDRQAIALLKRMPVNNEQRCVGISAVAEALLDGKSLPEGRTISVDKLATEIYENLHDPKHIAVPEQLEIDGDFVQTNSETALRALSNRVAELYKTDYYRLINSEQGRQNLAAAERQCVATKEKLQRLIDAEPDQVVFFCGFGWRWFPDGRIRRTSHAFLLSKRGEKCVVYDPNAPGEVIECTLSKNDSGLLVKWSGPYRNTGNITTQQYHIVESTAFFRTALR